MTRAGAALLRASRRAWVRLAAVCALLLLVTGLAVALTSNGSHHGSAQIAPPLAEVPSTSRPSAAVGATALTPGPVRLVVDVRADGLLSPGASAPLDITVHNDGGHAVSITRVDVTITDTSTSACSVANFQVTGYRGRYPLHLGARTHSSLRQLGATSATLPLLTMLDLPVNQNACRNVLVGLRVDVRGNPS